MRGTQFKKQVTHCKNTHKHDMYCQCSFFISNFILLLICVSQYINTFFTLLVTITRVQLLHF